MKKTPWYPASIKPVRSGEYEVREKDVGIVGVMFWFCGSWYWPVGFERDPIQRWNDAQWRGLTEEVK